MLVFLANIVCGREDLSIYKNSDLSYFYEERGFYFFVFSLELRESMYMYLRYFFFGRVKIFIRKFFNCFFRELYVFLEIEYCLVSV